MKLEGIHHITAITADAPGNVEFYVGTLGLRLVKKSVNQDDPTVYHLFYADEKGSPGSDITFFEYPGIPRGRPGAGMVHRIVWRVSSQEALDFWEHRLASRGIDSSRNETELSFSDPEGLGLQVSMVEVADEPLRAEHPEIPRDFALEGFDGVRAFADDPGSSADFFQGTLGFTAGADSEWEAAGDDRRSFYAFDEPPQRRGMSGAGTVHHVAWAARMNEHEMWRERVVSAGMHVTPVIDRYYFKSIYFHEPSGVLFEIATIGPGFTVDEPEDTLGQALALPPAYESMRDKLSEVLTPLPITRKSVTR